jgi:hypothetical protein
VRKTPDTLTFQVFGSFKSLGLKLSHETSKKVIDVRCYLRKSSKENFVFDLKLRQQSHLLTVLFQITDVIATEVFLTEFGKGSILLELFDTLIDKSLEFLTLLII